MGPVIALNPVHQARANHGMLLELFRQSLQEGTALERADRRCGRLDGIFVIGEAERHWGVPGRRPDHSASRRALKDLGAFVRAPGHKAALDRRTRPIDGDATRRRMSGPGGPRGRNKGMMRTKLLALRDPWAEGSRKKLADVPEDQFEAALMAPPHPTRRRHPSSAKTAEQRLLAAMQEHPGASINVLAKAAGTNRSGTGERLRGLASRGVVTKDSAGHWRLMAELAGERPDPRRRRPDGGAHTRTQRSWSGDRDLEMDLPARRL